MEQKRRRRAKKAKRLSILLIIITIIIVAVAVQAKKHDIEAKNTSKVVAASVKPKAEVKKDDTKKIVSEPKKPVPTVKKKTQQQPKKVTTTTTKKSTPKTTSTSKTKNNYKDTFKNDLFLGDSLTEGLSFYELIEDNNVIGIKGLTTVRAAGQAANIARRNPKNIFILLGDNDLQMAVSGEKFASNYANLIRAIKAKLPNANIYIQSIPPVTQKAEQKYRLINNSRVNQFNTAIKNMAQREKVNFLNISPVFKNNTGLYERDGIHLKFKFYGLWLEHIKNTTK